MKVAIVLSAIALFLASTTTYAQNQEVLAYHCMSYMTSSGIGEICW